MSYDRLDAVASMHFTGLVNQKESCRAALAAASLHSSKIWNVTPPPLQNARGTEDRFVLCEPRMLLVMQRASSYRNLRNYASNSSFYAQQSGLSSSYTAQPSEFIFYLRNA